MTLDQNDFTELNRGEGGDKMATSTEGELKVQKTHMVYRTTGGELQEVQNNGNRMPVEDLKHTDFEGVIGQNVDDAYTLVNPCAAATIGFHLTMPTDARVEFEGSFDLVNWISITYREIGGDGFRNHAHQDEDFIGSIAALRAVRWRTSEAGSAPGSVAGRIIDPPSTVEGIEHGNPPHNIGVNIWRAGIDISGVVADQTIKSPSAVYHPRRLIITGYALSMSGTGTIRLFDETNSADNWIFAGEVKSNDQSVISNHTFSPPFVTSAAGNSVKATTTSSATVFGTITGYEICQ